MTLLALLAACCAAFAPAPVYREPKAKPDRRTDEEKLQGTWELVSFAADGDAPRAPWKSWAVFSRGRMSYVIPGEDASYSFSLDPGASPKRIDLREGNGATLLGVYRLEGDRLTIAQGQIGDARPADFNDKRASPLLVFRRVKGGK